MIRIYGIKRPVDRRGLMALQGKRCIARLTEHRNRLSPSRIVLLCS